MVFVKQRLASGKPVMFLKTGTKILLFVHQE